MSRRRQLHGLVGTRRDRHGGVRPLQHDGLADERAALDAGEVVDAEQDRGREVDVAKLMDEPEAAVHVERRIERGAAKAGDVGDGEAVAIAGTHADDQGRFIGDRSRVAVERDLHPLGAGQTQVEQRRHARRVRRGGMRRGSGVCGRRGRELRLGRRDAKK
jgi:hypothetical protein